MWLSERRVSIFVYLAGCLRRAVRAFWIMGVATFMSFVLSPSDHTEAKSVCSVRFKGGGVVPVSLTMGGRALFILWLVVWLVGLGCWVPYS